MAEKPSWKEFKGYYNISPSLLGEVDDRAKFFYEKPGLRQPTHEECDSVIEDLMEIKTELRIPENQLYFNINYFDRTIGMAPRIPRFFNKEFIGKIQSKLLGKHPLWRAVIVASDDEKTFVVYADEIKFNQPNANLENELKQIREKEVAFLDQTIGVGERQLSFIQEKLKQMNLPSVSFDPIVLGVFDRAKDGSDSCAVWLLSNKRHNERSWLPEYEEFGWEGSLDSYDVDTKGNVTELYSAGASFLGCLSCQSFKKAHCQESIFLRNPDTRAVVAYRITEIVSDEELRKATEKARTVK
jgi:hypothetical protein